MMERCDQLGRDRRRLQKQHGSFPGIVSRRELESLDLFVPFGSSGNTREIGVDVVVEIGNGTL